MNNPEQTLKLPAPEPGYCADWESRFIQLDSFNEDSPKISIVTPSYNQGRFLEKTIRCILLQGYPNLEYIIVDGGSTDNTLDIIQKYEPWVTYWISESDTGMYNALNKGFAEATGEIMGWSPTGDLYDPDTLNIVGQIFAQLSKVEWLTSMYKVKCGEDGAETARYRVDGFSRRAFRKGLNFLSGSVFARYMVQQQSTFWRRSLWEKSGGSLNEAMKGAGDFELWSRFYNHATLYGVERALGVFMTHAGQESIANAGRLHLEQEAAFAKDGGKHMGKIEGTIRKGILRRRPFSWLKFVYPIGFRAETILWDSNIKTASIRKSYFV